MGTPTEDDAIDGTEMAPIPTTNDPENTEEPEFTEEELAELINKTSNHQQIPPLKCTCTPVIKSFIKENLKYPKSVFFIVSNEFCERFCYYGMRTILSLYLVDILFFSEPDAKIIYHTFTLLVYTFPVFGAMIADSYLGKFKTILYVSMIYAVGSLLLALAAVPPVHLPIKEFSLLGLFIIAIGTGGIKPCVAAFGGDQFILPQQEKQLGSFFSLFYFSINAGSLVSTTITPIIREDVHCFDDDSCYSLAFAIPGILMIVSIVIFALGRPLYRCKQPAGNMTIMVSKCIVHAISEKRKNKDVKKEHWLDYASDKFNPQLIADIKGLLKVLFLYLPLPVFWALFDQQGTGWTFQARRMSGDIGFYTILPDQMQVVNPLLILAFIPIFQYGVYPLLDKCHILRTPLQRLSTGMALAAISFIISALISLEMEKDYPIMAEPGEGQLRIYNGLSCTATIKGTGLNGGSEITIEALGQYEELYLKATKNSTTYTAQVTATCAGINGETQEFGVIEEKATAYFFYTNENVFKMARIEDDVEKATNGFPRIRTLINTNGPGVTIIYKDEDGAEKINQNSTDYDELVDIRPGKHVIEIGEKYKTDGEFKLGGVYAVIGHVNPKNPDQYEVKTLEVTVANRIHLLWLIPQYVVITAGEVMYSVTGVEFSYSQAPASMKSVVQAGWLLTSAGGNLLVVIIESFKLFEDQSSDFFLYAAIMLLDMVIFSLMAMKYTYVEVKDEHSENDLSMAQVEKQNGTSNPGFKDDNDA